MTAPRTASPGDVPSGGAGLNEVWAGVLVDELARCGLRHAVVCPGSRSAPLAIALRRHPGIEVRVLLDERGAGYFAVGLARATGAPAAVLTTSGTAAVNLHPAIVEADQGAVPLIALTADRPPELIDVGANQAVRQAGLFGASVRWQASLMVPEASEAALRHVRQVACRAHHAARDGPVHLNVPFREPLHPVAAVAGAPASPPARDSAMSLALRGRPDGRPFLEASPRILAPVPWQPKGGRGLVVLGPGSPAPPAFAGPVLADPLSGHAGSIDGYDAFLTSPAARDRLRPDWILQLGASPTSKSLRAFLASLPDVPRALVDPLGRAWDESQTPCTLLPTADGARLPAAGPDWTAQWRELAAVAKAASPVHQDWEGPVAAAIAAARPDLVWVASSLPVRDLDRFAAGQLAGARVLANRGASGIDGTLSAAAGAASATSGRCIAYVGDLAFLHDLGGLAAVQRHAPHLTLVVLNNQGGRIFEHLPVAESIPREEFEELFAAPQDVDIGKACVAFGVPHVKLEGTRDLAATLQGHAGGVVEVAVDPLVAARRRREHLASVVAAADAAVARWQPAGRRHNGEEAAEVRT